MVLFDEIFLTQFWYCDYTYEWVKFRLLTIFFEFYFRNFFL